MIVPLALAALFLSTAAVSLGALLGFSMGLVLEEEYVRFGTRGAWWKQIVKFAIGVAIALGLRFALKPLSGMKEIDTRGDARYNLCARKKREVKYGNDS